MKKMIIHLQNQGLEFSMLEKYSTANGTQYSVDHGLAKLVLTSKRLLIGFHYDECFQSWFFTVLSVSNAATQDSQSGVQEPSCGLFTEEF